MLLNATQIIIDYMDRYSQATFREPGQVVWWAVTLASDSKDSWAVAPLQGPWGQWLQFSYIYQVTQGIHTAGNSTMPGRLLGLYVLVSLLAFTTVRLLTCCQCSFLRSLLICKWEQMSKRISWNMGADKDQAKRSVLHKSSVFQRPASYSPLSKDIPTQSQ